MQIQERRFDYIDALRGLAIAGVVLVHCSQIVEGLPAHLSSFAHHGAAGVALFFILSALTLKSVYSGRNVNVAEFLTRRFFRVAPMFYLGSIFYLCLLGTAPQAFAPNGIHFHQVFLTFLFLHSWFPDSFNSVMPGGWSIGDEIMFYLCFVPLLTILINLRRACIAFVIAAVISHATIVFVPKMLGSTDLNNIYAGFSFPAHIVTFIGGFVTYFLIENLSEFKILHRKTIANIIFFASLVILVIIASSPIAKLGNQILTVSILIPFIFATALSQIPILVNYPMILLGRLSYSVYITHFAIVLAAHKIFMPLLPLASPTSKLLLLYILVMSLSIMLSSLTYRWIEMPLIAFGKSITSSRT